MSNIAKFILKNLDSPISNNLLLGTSYLQDRIRFIKTKYGETDKQTVLSELNRTHLIHVYSEYKQTTPIANEYIKLQSRSGQVSWGSEAIFDLPEIGHFWSDMVLNLTIGEIGNKTGKAYNDDPLYSYCDLPGLRIVEEVSLTIDGNPIDKYTSDDALMTYSFETSPLKRTSLERCLGQEQPKHGYVVYNDLSVRERCDIMSGQQTPRPYQPALDMWIPTFFWFNKGIENALCSGYVPYGQRFVKFKFSNVENILRKSNISEDTLPLKASDLPQITKCTLYVNNIILDPAVYELFLEKVTFRVARVFNSMTSSLTTPFGRVWINKFKYPTEYMYFGFRPMSNKSTVEHWNKFKVIAKNPVPVPIASYGNNSVPELSRENINYWEESNVINELTITVGNGLRIHQNIVPEFFNSYLPFIMPNITSPNDTGLFMLPFNQRPLVNEVTGYMDMSRIRDLYIEYTSSYINNDTEVELVLSSKSINFLVISKTMALRFTT